MRIRSHDYLGSWLRLQPSAHFSVNPSPLLFLYPRWYREGQTLNCPSPTLPWVRHVHQQNEPSQRGRPLPFKKPFNTDLWYQKEVQSANEFSNAFGTSRATSEYRNGPVRSADRYAASHIPGDYRYDDDCYGEFDSQSPPPTAADSFRTADVAKAPSSWAHPARPVVRRLVSRRRGRPIDDMIGLFDRLHPPRRDKPNSWITPLRMLKAWTEPNPPDLEKRRVVMMLPRALVAKFQHDTEITLEDVGENHQCRVDLISEEDSETSHRRLMVVGTKEAIEKLRCSLIEAIPKLQSSIDQVYMSDRKDPDWLFSSPIPMVHRKKYYPYQRADEIPRPAVWTMATFAEYIYQLCQRGMPRATHRVLYGPEEEHSQEVMKVLHRLLQDRAVQSAITLPAFHDILRFLVHHRHHGYTRVLLADADEMRLPLDATTFNIQLKGLAPAQDIKPFRPILQSMIDHGLKPTGETWVAFLMCVDEVEVKRYCISMMRKLGFLDNLSTLKDAVEQVLPDVLVDWLDQGKDFESFVQYMDNELGPLWLTTSAANKMLQEVGQRGWIQECFTIWDALLGRGVKLDIVSFNTLLSRCTAGPDAGDAFQVLERALQVIKLGEAHDIPRDAVSYQIMMRMASNCRLYNTSRVVWRYACMEGLVRFPMQVRVSSTLITNTSRAHNPALDLWEKTSGKVIVGISYPEENFQPGWTSAGDEQEVTRTRNIMVKLCRWTCHPTERLPQVDLVKGMLRRDLDAWHWVRPVRPFIELVKEALVMDQRWAQQESASGVLMSGVWRIEHAIDVPVVARERYLAVHPPSSPVYEHTDHLEASTPTSYDTDID